MVIKSTIAAVVVISLASLAGAQEKKKEWKDRGEYDLYESITKTQDPNQWLAAIDKWKAQYPQSDYADVRRQLTLETYRALNKPREAFDAAGEVLKDNRPPAMTDAQAAQAKPQLKAFAQKTVGYIAIERKDYKTAQSELTKALELDPNQAQVSFWLGTALLAQNQANPELQPAALYEFARSAAYDGTGALPLTDRKQVQDYLTKVYAQYHGSNDGLDKLMASSRMSALPPAGFSVKSKVDMERERIQAEEAAARANPMLALWKRIKSELQGPEGAAYFENNMKGAALPAGVNGVTKFKGKIVSMTPESRPKEIVLAIEGMAQDATLKLDSALPGKMEPGAEIEFDGVAESYTKDPFMVTFNVEKSHVEGWMGKNAPAGKKHTITKKSGGN